MINVAFKGALLREGGVLRDDPGYSGMRPECFPPPRPPRTGAGRRSGMHPGARKRRGLDFKKQFLKPLRCSGMRPECFPPLMNGGQKGTPGCIPERSAKE